MLSLLLTSSLITSANAQVVATGPNGPTNPDHPSFAAVGTTVNQKSDARLLSVNAIDDFCLFAPMDPNAVIGDVEHNVVAWCTKPRNDARLIPDGTIKSAQFLRTPTYVQVSGWWDGTRLNIRDGDDGGELDPHGATGEGNPVGGNVTTNVPNGQDVFYEVSGHAGWSVLPEVGVWGGSELHGGAPLGVCCKAVRRTRYASRIEAPRPVGPRERREVQNKPTACSDFATDDPSQASRLRTDRRPY